MEWEFGQNVDCSFTRENLRFDNSNLESHLDRLFSRDIEMKNNMEDDPSWTRSSQWETVNVDESDFDIINLRTVLIQGTKNVSGYYDQST